MTGQKRKELLIHALRVYTLLVTLITILLIILGKLLDRDRVFSYEAFLSPLIYALIGTVAAIITRSDKELSVRNLIIRKVISLLLIEGTISNLIYKGDHYSYVINTELGQDFIVDDEFLWNMGDRIGLILPIDKMRFTVKK